MNRIAVVTRLAYDRGDPKFMKRVELYKKYTLPSLLAQTDQDFDIWVWCKPHHAEIIKAIHPRIQVFHGEWVKRENTKYFINFTSYDNLQGFSRYETQLGLDSDDEIAPTAIAEIRKNLNGERKAISLQPIKRDVNTGKKYNMKSYAEKDKLSPIFAIYQPKGVDEFIFVYQYGHYSGMPTKFDVVVYLYGLAIMNLHESNESTRLEEYDEEL